MGVNVPIRLFDMLDRNVHVAVLDGWCHPDLLGCDRGRPSALRHAGEDGIVVLRRSLLCATFRCHARSQGTRPAFCLVDDAHDAGLVIFDNGASEDLIEIAGAGNGWIRRIDGFRWGWTGVRLAHPDTARMFADLPAGLDHFLLVLRTGSGRFRAVTTVSRLIPGLEQATEGPVISRRQIGARLFLGRHRVAGWLFIGHRRFIAGAPAERNASSFTRVLRGEIGVARFGSNEPTRRSSEAFSVPVVGVEGRVVEPGVRIRGPVGPLECIEVGLPPAFIGRSGLAHEGHVPSARSRRASGDGRNEVDNDR